jgi:glutathione synthase
VIFVVSDVVGDCLTEINVPSPAVIQEIARLDGVEIAPKIWDAIEARLAERANRIPA